MLIECPSCARSYTISLADLGEGGRSVVCSTCRTRWFVAPSARTAIEGRLQPRPARAIKPLPRRGASFSIGLSAACLVVAMGAIGERTPIVRLAPGLAAVYAAIGLPVNVRSLEFKDVKTTRSDEAGQTSVAISGIIRNVAHSRTSVPRITFDIRDVRGLTIASWTDVAAKRVLVGEETVAFATRTQNLPADAKDVVLRFAADKDPVSNTGNLLAKRR